jgi:uroporphyrinogen decarboxylase
MQKHGQGITPRERIRNAMDFKQLDAIPWAEEFYVETVNNFFSEGLPAQQVNVVDWELDGKGLNWPKLLGFDVNSYFGCMNLSGYILPIDFGPIPRFKQRKIGEDSRYEDFIMQNGAHARRFKKGARENLWYNMPQFQSFPVSERNSWDGYKGRLNPEDPRRYPKDWDREGYLEAIDQYEDGPTALEIPGFYGFGAELMGISGFVLAFHKNPDLIEDMASYWEYHVIESSREAVETLKDRIDFVWWWEDLAERHGPNISPRLYKEFLLPHYKKVTAFLNRNKIHRILMDSDGNTMPILDMVIKAGINGQWPLEVNAGMDVRAIRKMYGKRLFLAGNLDKREIAKGGEAMRKEIDSKLPFMKETGGYVVGLDHLVPVEFTLDKFREYANYLKDKLFI